MRGNLLKAYCLLAEASDCLRYIRTPNNERVVNELQSKIRQAKKGIYDLGGEE